MNPSDYTQLPPQTETIGSLTNDLKKEKQKLTKYEGLCKKLFVENPNTEAIQNEIKKLPKGKTSVKKIVENVLQIKQKIKEIKAKVKSVSVAPAFKKKASNAQPQAKKPPAPAAKISKQSTPLPKQKKQPISKSINSEPTSTLETSVSSEKETTAAKGLFGHSAFVEGLSRQFAKNVSPEATQKNLARFAQDFIKQHTREGIVDLPSIKEMLEQTKTELSNPNSQFMQVLTQRSTKSTEQLQEKWTSRINEQIDLEKSNPTSLQSPIDQPSVKQCMKTLFATDPKEGITQCVAKGANWVRKENELQLKNSPLHFVRESEEKPWTISMGEKKWEVDPQFFFENTKVRQPFKEDFLPVRNSESGELALLKFRKNDKRLLLYQADGAVLKPLSCKNTTERLASTMHYLDALVTLEDQSFSRAEKTAFSQMRNLSRLGRGSDPTNSYYRTVIRQRLDTMGVPKTSQVEFKKTEDSALENPNEEFQKAERTKLARPKIEQESENPLKKEVLAKAEELHSKTGTVTTERIKNLVEEFVASQEELLDMSPYFWNANDESSQDVAQKKWKQLEKKEGRYLDQLQIKKEALRKEINDIAPFSQNMLDKWCQEGKELDLSSQKKSLAPLLAQYAVLESKIKQFNLIREEGKELTPTTASDWNKKVENHGKQIKQFFDSMSFNTLNESTRAMLSFSSARGMLPTLKQQKVIQEGYKSLYDKTNDPKKQIFLRGTGEGKSTVMIPVLADIALREEGKKAETDKKTVVVMTPQQNQYELNENCMRYSNALQKGHPMRSPSLLTLNMTTWSKEELLKKVPSFAKQLSNNKGKKAWGCSVEERFLLHEITEKLKTQELKNEKEKELLAALKKIDYMLYHSVVLADEADSQICPQIDGHDNSHLTHSVAFLTEEWNAFCNSWGIQPNDSETSQLRANLVSTQTQFIAGTTEKLLFSATLGPEEIAMLITDLGTDKDDLKKLSQTVDFDPATGPGRSLEWWVSSLNNSPAFSFNEESDSVDQFIGQMEGDKPFIYIDTDQALLKEKGKMLSVEEGVKKLYEKRKASLSNDQQKEALKIAFYANNKGDKQLHVYDGQKVTPVKKEEIDKNNTSTYLTLGDGTGSDVPQTDDHHFYGGLGLHFEGLMQLSGRARKLEEGQKMTFIYPQGKGPKDFIDLIAEAERNRHSVRLTKHSDAITGVAKGIVSTFRSEFLRKSSRLLKNKAKLNGLHRDLENSTQVEQLLKAGNTSLDEWEKRTVATFDQSIQEKQKIFGYSQPSKSKGKRKQPSALELKQMIYVPDWVNSKEQSVLNRTEYQNRKKTAFGMIKKAFGKNCNPENICRHPMHFQAAVKKFWENKTLSDEEKVRKLSTLMNNLRKKGVLATPPPTSPKNPPPAIYDFLDGLCKEYELKEQITSDCIEFKNKIKKLQQHKKISSDSSQQAQFLSNTIEPIQRKLTFTTIDGQVIDAKTMQGTARGIEETELEKWANQESNFELPIPKTIEKPPENKVQGKEERVNVPEGDSKVLSDAKVTKRELEIARINQKLQWISNRTNELKSSYAKTELSYRNSFRQHLDNNQPFIAIKGNFQNLIGEFEEIEEASKELMNDQVMQDLTDDEKRKIDSSMDEMNQSIKEMKKYSESCLENLETLEEKLKKSQEVNQKKPDFSFIGEIEKDAKKYLEKNEKIMKNNPDISGWIDLNEELQLGLQAFEQRIKMSLEQVKRSGLKKGEWESRLEGPEREFGKIKTQFAEVQNKLETKLKEEFKAIENRETTSQKQLSEYLGSWSDQVQEEWYQAREINQNLNNDIQKTQQLRSQIKTLCTEKQLDELDKSVQKKLDSKQQFEEVMDDLHGLFEQKETHERAIQKLLDKVDTLSANQLTEEEMQSRLNQCEIQLNEVMNSEQTRRNKVDQIKPQDYSSSPIDQNKRKIEEKIQSIRNQIKTTQEETREAKQLKTDRKQRAEAQSKEKELDNLIRNQQLHEMLDSIEPLEIEESAYENITIEEFNKIIEMCEEMVQELKASQLKLSSLKKAVEKTTTDATLREQAESKVQEITDKLQIIEANRNGVAFWRNKKIEEENDS